MPKKEVPYTGFGLRFIALGIDSILLIIVYYIIRRILFYTPLSSIKIVVISWSIYLIFDAFYEIYLTHKYGGTLGKILMKCYVVNSKQNYLTVKQSIGRYFAKILSGLIIGIGYLMILWDPEKRGLHDMIVNSHVVANPKSKINDKVKKSLIITILLIFLIYLIYQISLISFSIVFGIQAVMKEVGNTVTPIDKIINECNSKVFWLKDYCFIMYGSQDDYITSLNISSRIDFCSNIKRNNIHSECLSAVAVKYNNESICSHARSKFSYNNCIKAYSLSKSLLSRFYDMDEDYLDWGDLDGGHVEIGIVKNNDCIPIGKNIFYKDETGCFMIKNISGFEKDEDELSYYDLDIKTYDSNGNLIDYSKSIISFARSRRFLKNGVLDEEIINSRLSHLEPGDYTYEFIMYDEIGYKKAVLNRTISILAYPVGSLEIQNAIIGLVFEDDWKSYCLAKANNTFQPGDKVCLEPYNVRGFEKDDTNLYSIDMDLKITDSEGNIVDYNRDAFYGDGNPIKYLINKKLNGFFLYTSLEDYVIGEYLFEAKVKDDVSRKQVTVQRKFNVQGGRYGKSRIVVDTVKILTSNKYYIDGISYDVEVISINKEEGAIFKINEEMTPKLKDKEAFTLQNGVDFGVDLIYNSNRTAVVYLVATQ